MKVEEAEILLDGVLVKSTGYVLGAKQPGFFKQFLWHHTAISDVTGQSVPQHFYANVVIDSKRWEDVEHVALLEKRATEQLKRFISDAKAGKGHLPPCERVGMMASRVYEVLQNEHDVINGCDELLRDKIFTAIKEANDDYELNVDRLLLFGGDLSDWSIPIKPLEVQS